ncbi:MAG: RHS repeat-associated core domain-containing protein, partial [Gammaproteobacteria bacterium]
LGAPNEPGYTGKFEEPGLGIQNFGARWYDPRIGRFLAIDPAGFDPQNPQSFNRYAYANNNPYKYVDPNGESPLDVGFFIVVTVSFGLAVYSGNPQAIASAGSDLSASAVGLASPIPGTGLAIKAARAADKVGDAVRVGKEAVVIGENMTRVEKYAAKIGANRFKGEGMDANRTWIQQAKADRKQVIDIGPHFERRAERIQEGSRPDSPFYNMERSETRGYEGYEKVFERTGKNSGGAPGVD